MEHTVHPGSIAIVDFGGQYAHLIGSRIRRLGAFSEIVPPETSADQLKDATGIILSGGPQSVYDAGSPQADPKIFELGKPILGICYGHQWIAHALQGTVKPGKTKEYGRAQITITNPTAIPFPGVPPETTVWMSHGDAVQELPRGFQVTATSEDCPVAAMANVERRIFGIQFHVEVTHTTHGQQMLSNFVDLCNPAPWNMRSYRDHIGNELKAQVGDRKVFMLVSGGVDSTVAFTLLNEVLGTDRVQGLLVDTGLMRKNEVKMIEAALGKLGINNLKAVDASSEFFAALGTATEPEEKRKIIGDMFLSVQRRVAEEMALTGEKGWLLGQGTIYPDTIETGGTKHADKIKTHHNRVEAIQKMMEQGLVVEPLKELYKDEVRKLGEELGLPHDLVWRHPFPGPGLGVRILCTKEPEAIASLPKSPIEQSSVLPVKSVGVQGDGRTYRHAIAVFRNDPLMISEELIQLATEVPNKYKDFNRVLLCTSHSSPVEFTASAMGMTKERADSLREADAIVDEEVRKAGLHEQIWQLPVVLLPCGVVTGSQSIVLRPIASIDAMTADAFVLPSSVTKVITERILKFPGISAVLYDLTSKPPGTIEWE